MLLCDRDLLREAFQNVKIEEMCYSYCDFERGREILPWDEVRCRCFAGQSHRATVLSERLVNLECGAISFAIIEY